MSTRGASLPACLLGSILALGATGCGRSGFARLSDAPVETVDAARPPCLSTTFADGDLSELIQIEGDWMIVPSAGPDGSPALRGGGFGQGHQLISHRGIQGITEARIALDFLTVDLATGDFIVDVLGRGWTMREDPHYAAEVFPPGSDSSPDQIIWETPMTIDRIAIRASTAAAGVWHRLVVTFAVDHSMVVELDGALHMTSAADARTAGPFDIVLHLYNEGFIDNVVVDCVR